MLRLVRDTTKIAFFLNLYHTGHTTIFNGIQYILFDNRLLHNDSNSLPNAYLFLTHVPVKKRKKQDYKQDSSVGYGLSLIYI